MLGEFKFNNFQLLSYDLKSNILNNFLKSEFNQIYINNTDKNVEGRYYFPLLENHSVSNVDIRYKDKWFSAKIKETQKATEKYSDAIASGHQSFLISKKGNEIQILLGNIEKGEKVEFKISTIGPAISSNGDVLYTLYSNMFPKCISNDFQFNFQLKVTQTFGIKLLDCFGLENYFKIVGSEDSTTYTLTTQEYLSKYLSNEKSIVIKPNVTMKPETLIEYNPQDKTYAVSLTFYPTITQGKSVTTNESFMESNSEFIFVLDYSGSMEGSRIKNAKTALIYFINSLNEQHIFNIYLFGSDFKKLSNSSLPYNNDSIKKAYKFIDSINGDLGGTNILTSLKDITKSKVKSQYPRKIFILTDGEFDSSSTVIDFVKNSMKSERIFVLGIGSSCGYSNLKQITDMRQGFVDRISDSGAGCDIKVIDLLEKSMKPILCNVKANFNYDNKLVTIYSSALRDPVFVNERISYFFLIKSTGDNQLQTGDVTLELSGTLLSKEIITYTIPLNLTDAIQSNSNDIHKLVCSVLFTNTQKDIDYVHDHEIELSKTYNILSNYTSYLVISKSTSPTTDMDIIDITNQNHLLESEKQLEILQMQQSILEINQLCQEIGQLVSEQSISAIEPGIQSCLEANTHLCSASVQPSFFSKVASFFSSSSSSSSSGTSYKKSSVEEIPEEPLVVIIKSQNANGSWDLSGKLPFTYNPDLMKPSTTLLPNQLIDSVWITFLVLSLLNIKHPNEQSLSLISQKAIRFIKSQLEKNNLSQNFVKLLEESNKIISNL